MVGPPRHAGTADLGPAMREYTLEKLHAMRVKDLKTLLHAYGVSEVEAVEKDSREVAVVNTRMVQIPEPAHAGSAAAAGAGTGEVAEVSLLCATSSNASWSLTLSLDGRPVLGSPFSWRVAPGQPSIERCLLHLDLSTLDINAAVQVCVQHKLFSALVNVYNRGLMDYTTPIDLLLVPVMEPVVPATGGDASSTAMTTPGGAQPAEHTTAVQKLLARTDEEQRRIGYKLLLYLQYCLLGRAFPRGDVPPHILPTLRADVMSFLFEERPATFPCFGDTLTFASTHGGAAAAGVRSAAEVTRSGIAARETPSACVQRTVATMTRSNRSMRATGWVGVAASRE